MDDAIEAGIPSELDGVNLRLPDANFIAETADLMIERNPGMRWTTGVRLGVRQLRRTHEAVRGRYRKRRRVRLSGEDAIIIRL